MAPLQLFGSVIVVSEDVAVGVLSGCGLGRSEEARSDERGYQADAERDQARRIGCVKVRPHTRKLPRTRTQAPRHSYLSELPQEPGLRDATGPRRQRIPFKTKVLLPQNELRISNSTSRHCRKSAQTSCRCLPS